MEQETGIAPADVGPLEPAPMSVVEVPDSGGFGAGSSSHRSGARTARTGRTSARSRAGAVPTKPVAKPGGTLATHPPAGGRERPTSASAPATGSRGTPAEREPRGRLTIRAVVLGFVLLVACVLVVPTLNTYLKQQEELRDLRAQVTEASATLDDMNAQLDRWNDPDYIKAQARERLAYAMPGETAYRIVDPQTVQQGDDKAAAPHDDGTFHTGDGTAPWYVALWDSAVVAGEAGAR